MWYADGSIHITDNVKHLYISLCCMSSKEIQIVKEDAILLTIVDSGQLASNLEQIRANFSGVESTIIC